MEQIDKHIQDAAVTEHESFGEKKNKGWNTPKEIIADVVSEAVGLGLKEDRRIVNGETNEVHEVVTESEQEIIVRIFHGEKPKFAREKWALEQCKGKGVPVPEMYLVKSIKVGDETREVCVESKIPGQSLDKFSKSLDTEHAGELKDILNQLGKMLREIHSIPTQGFGKLDDKGVGLFETVEKMIARDKYIGQDSILPAFKDDPAQTATLMNAYDILKRNAGMFGSVKPCLIHNDLSPEHVFVKDGNISGLIDFEVACGADPVQDLALWDFKFNTKFPLEYIIEGYCSDGTVIEDFKRRLAYWKIYRAMASLRYCIREKKPGGIERAMKAIRDGCDPFE